MWVAGADLSSCPLDFDRAKYSKPVGRNAESMKMRPRLAKWRSARLTAAPGGNELPVRSVTRRWQTEAGGRRPLNKL